MVAVSPNGNNTIKIPNEDSQNIDLSDYNLFQENHISGYDILEDGLRVNYGVRGVVSTDLLGDYNFLLGQNYRAKTDPQTFSEASGLSDNYSDFVGRIITGSKKVQSSYRFRLDKDNFQFKRNEVGFNIDLSPVQLATSYIFIAGDPLVTAKDRQEISSSGTFKLTDEFSLTSHATRNMDNDDNQGWVNAGTGVIYTNSCLTSTIELNKEFTRDRDIKPATELIFKISLQNFGS
jgi:LPS-assembly protein